MISSLVIWMQSIIIPLGGWGVFIGSFLEEVIAPIPSAFVQITSGFLLFQGTPLSTTSFIKFFLTVPLPAGIGVALGSILVYSLTYFLGKPFIVSYGRYFGLTWHMVETFEKKYIEKGHGLWGVFFGRLIPAIPGPLVSSFAGVLRIPFRKYFVVSTIGTFCRAILYGLIGWQLGSLYKENSGFLSRVENIILYVCVVAVFIFLVYKYILYHRKKQHHD